MAENFGVAHMHKKSLRHKGVALKAQAVKAEGKKFSLVKISSLVLYCIKYCKKASYANV